MTGQQADEEIKSETESETETRTEPQRKRTSVVAPEEVEMGPPLSQNKPKVAERSRASMRRPTTARLEVIGINQRLGSPCISRLDCSGHTEQYHRNPKQTPLLGCSALPIHVPSPYSFAGINNQSLDNVFLSTYANSALFSPTPTDNRLHERRLMQLVTLRAEFHQFIEHIDRKTWEILRASAASAASRADL